MAEEEIQAQSSHENQKVVLSESCTLGSILSCTYNNATHQEDIHNYCNLNSKGIPVRVDEMRMAYCRIPKDTVQSSSLPQRTVPSSGENSKVGGRK